MGSDRFAFAVTDRIGKAIAGPSAISNALSRPACDRRGQAQPRFGVLNVGIQVGAVSSPASQPTAPDLSGSDAMTLIST